MLSSDFNNINKHASSYLPYGQSFGTNSNN